MIGTLADYHDQPRAAVVMDSGLSPCGLPRNDGASDLPDK
jgi:hypothetical protein